MTVKTRKLSACLVGLLCLLAVAATPALAQVSFNNFSDVSSLALNGSAASANNGTQQVLRLTPDGTVHVSGTAWFKTQQQSVGNGFTSAFQFQITHNPNNGSGLADGLAFVIQNSGEGFGTAARGGSGGAIGYGVPDPGDNGVAIPNSLAVEFDTYQNGWDPNANHIAVQSCGLDANTQDHTATCPDGSKANLGIVSDLGGINLADGAMHTAVIEYDPGTLKIYIDNLGLPVLTISTDLSTLLNLNGDSGTAWVGFTGSTGGFTETNDILNWNFAPANTPTPIEQILNVPPPNQTAQTNYLFGSYNHKLQYQKANDGDNVTVTAIPIAPKTFHDTRLWDSNFPNAQCVPYGGAGGNCVLFEVTCTQATGSDCTDLDYDLFNNFDGPIISGACVLKATIDQDNWQNIIETFTQGRDDGGGKSGSKGFSDFIFAQNCSGPPTAAISSPADGSTVIVGQIVTFTFTCARPDNAPLVTVTDCSGLLNGTLPVHSGDQMAFDQVGTQILVVTATDSVLDTGTATSTFTVGQAPAFTSANNTTFQVGIAGSFLVTTTGSPAAVISTGALPGGVTLTSHGDGTATLSGTPASNTGGAYNITLLANNSAGNAMQSFTLTVLQTPAITTGNNATFQVGVQSSFTVTATGFPIPSLSEAGALPNGVGFIDNGNGTGTLSGKPTVSGVYPITFTATNSAGNTNQPFTLTVVQTPAITSANNTTFQVNVQGSFTVTSTGYPTPGLTESGALPSGVGFINNGNGTGTLSGKPTVSGTFPISFTATNTAGSSTQNFTLTVTGGVQVSFTPTSINFGNVRYGNLLWQNVVVKNTGTATLQFSKINITLGHADWDDFTLLNLCPKSLAAGKSCVVTVFFFGDDLGQRTATLNFADNAPNSPQQIPLSANVVKH